MVYKTINILLVEDEKAHVTLIQRAFESHAGQISLTVAGTLKEGRAYITQSPPDLMIVDLVLPDGNGIDFLPADNEECRFPIVLMTCRGSEQVAVEAMKAGALDYVVKSEAIFSDMPRIAERALRQWEHITNRKQAEEALQRAHDELEEQVEQRTAELVKANKELNRETEDRTRAEQAARQSEERFFKTFHASPVGIAITTVEGGRFVDVNDSLLRMLGYTRDEVIGRTKVALGVWITPEDRVQIVQELKARGGPIQRRETLLRTKSGEVCQGVLFAELIDIEGGECLLTMVDDVTERKQAQETLRRTERLNALGTLVAGIAHEINNPVGSAMLAAETALAIKDDPDNAEPFEKCLNNVVASLDRCGRIVRNMLTFARDEPAEKRPYQISDVIRQSRDLVRSYAQRHQATIRLALDRDLPEVVVGRLDMELALLNLLRNAIEAGGEDGQVVIRAELADAGVRISIEDNGSGMTDEQKKRLFDPFYTTRQIQGGTGLGLSITYGIVQDHGGTIEVDSTAGEGTTVTVTLPAHENHT